ncbi:MAG: hypothetical protein AAF628_08475 [Planctomycetota bacterium]
MELTFNGMNRPMGRVNTPVGICVYPHLTSPDTKFKARGEFHSKLAFESDEIEELAELVEEARDIAQAEWEKDAKAADKKKLTLFDSVTDEEDDEGEPTGRKIIRVAMYHTTESEAKGKTFTFEPRVWDAMNKPLDLDGLEVWGGSRIRCAVDLVPWYSAKDKQLGIKLRLFGFQIIELRNGGNGGVSPFGETEGYVADHSQSKPEDDAPFSDDDSDDGDY